MKNKLFFLFTTLLSSTLLPAEDTIRIIPEQIPGKSKADFNAPSSGYGSSSVQAQLRLEVKDGTKAIHFIRDNNDPYVITKAYELKHADPYGLRWYLNAIINAKRVDQNRPSVAALKFNNGRKLLIVDASMTELIRPALYGSYHNIENITAETDRTDKYTVVGTACESTDRFDENVSLRRSVRGDLLTIKSAGAYGMSMASRYNLHDLPGAVYGEDLM